MDTHTDRYANSARVAASVFEVLIEFILLTPKELAADGPTAETFRVRMSPQHAKALAALLAKHVSEYERQFGVQLPIPGEMQQLWDELKAGETK